jgi:hypothetical protein
VRCVVLAISGILLGIAPQGMAGAALIGVCEQHQRSEWENNPDETQTTYILPDGAQTQGWGCGPQTSEGGGLIVFREVALGQSEPAPPTFENSDTLFAYGFGAVLMFWAIGVGVGSVLSFLRNRD